MKIINRKQFLKLKGPILYSKFEPDFWEPLSIKWTGQTDYTPDFLCTEVHDAIPAALHGSGDPDSEMQKAIDGKGSIVMDFTFCGRDAMFEHEKLFAIWEEQDLLKFKDIIDQCLISSKEQKI